MSTFKEDCERKRLAHNKARAIEGFKRVQAEELVQYGKAYDLALELWGGMLTNRDPSEVGFYNVSLLIDNGFAFLTVDNELALTDNGEDSINPQPFTGDP